MIIPVTNGCLNLPPLIKVRAFIQKNGKYIYQLVGGMIPNFLRTCLSWDSIKLWNSFPSSEICLNDKNPPPQKILNA